MRYSYSNMFVDNPLIDVFFEIKASVEEETQRDLILPDCTPGLMFVEENGFQRIHEHRSTQLLPGKLYLFGQKTKVVEYCFEQSQFRAFGVKLKPAAVFSLFQIEAAEITDKVIDLQGVIGEIRMPDELLGRKGIDILSKQKCLLRLLQQKNLPDHLPLLHSLLQDIHCSKGEVAIQSLVKKYQVGYKKIERLFKRHVGITPKRYARIVRFYQSVVAGTKSDKPRLTDLGYQSGFFDQNHFIKETKTMTGKTPSQVFGKAAYVFEPQHLTYLSQRGY